MRPFSPGRDMLFAFFFNKIFIVLKDTMSVKIDLFWLSAFHL